MNKLIPKYQFGKNLIVSALPFYGPLYQTTKTLFEDKRGHGGKPSDPVRQAYINGNLCEDCARASNFVMNRSGYNMYGDAWTRNGITLYNGYEHVNKPDSYSRSSYNNFNYDAADDLKQNFDTTTLDPNKLYDVNIYVTNSPNGEKAWNNHTNNRYGSHTGHLYHNGSKWKMFHNIHGNIYEDDLSDVLGSDYNWGITGIFQGVKK